MKTPVFPDDAPFNLDQKSWLSGYMAGLNSQMDLATKSNLAHSDEGAMLQPLHVLYGTQTGNAEVVAQELVESAQSHGFAPELHELDSVSLAELQDMRHALFVVSTYGEGEMPDNAQLFWEALSLSTAPRMEHLKYGVLGLGDTSYDDFCEAGKSLDRRLEQLGASRLIPRLDCDVEYEVVANEWALEVLPLAKEDDPEDFELNHLAKTKQTKPIASVKKSIWNKKNPFGARIIENQLLSRPGSDKEVRHVSFDLSESGITYAPGDTLNVLPINHDHLVFAILKRLRFDYELTIDGYDLPIGELLKRSFEIMTPSRDLLSFLSKKGKSEDLKLYGRSSDKAEREKIIWGMDTLDLLNLESHLELSANEFLQLLRPLQHRAYSISSSLQAHPNQAHVTVAAVRWNKNEREHGGVASTWLAKAEAGVGKYDLFFSSNKNFRLPKDESSPIIMVGPGTGIAPFRAFLQERECSGVKAKNWLFFGDRRRKFDFLYRQEIEDWVDRGLITKLDLAFSREHNEKVYVQHRMLENSTALFSWLEEGATFYICGDANRMAVDVEMALLQIIEKEGSLNRDGALDYLSTLKREKRYLRDVY